jgi:hypothetical protein
MSLLSLWRNAPEETLTKNIRTLHQFATDSGKLKDDAQSSDEFRKFLSEVEGEQLAQYARYCVENAFPDSGQILQDVVNEIGRRLGFVVENGRYQGVRNDIGFDGIWSADNESIVVEVKTTDAYSIKIDTVMRYRDRLAADGRIPESSTALYVVGREDSGTLEAQVRGSRHAWSIRIIGIDALIQLMEVNTNTSGEEVTRKIHAILKPLEYTRVDGIVDIVFATAEDKEISVSEQMEASEEIQHGSQDRTPIQEINDKKSLAIKALSQREGVALRKVKHSMYANSDESVRAVVVASKRYGRDSDYWYAYHEKPQREFLSKSENSYYLMSMTDRQDVYAVPFQEMEKHWDQLGETVRKNGTRYKHIVLDDRDGEIFLRVRTIDNLVSLEPYKVQIR